MKKQVFKIMAVDIGAILMFCLLSRYAESFLSMFERVSDYAGIMPMISTAVISLTIPVAYVAITKIVGTENDFLILWNMPLMASITGAISLLLFLLPAFADIMPHYSALMIFATSYVLSHGILRLANGN